MGNGKHFVVGLEQDVLDKAEQNCRRRGTTLRKKIEQTITEQASETVPDEKAFILESDAINEAWCPSRATLFALRKDKTLKEGKLDRRGKLNSTAHYFIRDGLIFYSFARLREHCRSNYSHIEQASANGAG